MMSSSHSGSAPATQICISVALCTYNGVTYLEPQLRSLSAQTVESLEIVAVDDGSHDGSWELLCQYATVEPRLRLYRNKENLGFAGNFQKAMSLCRGQFIALCDQDDVWHPEKLSVLLAAIEGRSAAYCDSELVDEHGMSLGKTLSTVLHMYQGADPAAFVFKNCVSGHALLFRRELLLRAGSFPPTFFHDHWLAFVAASCEGIAYVDRPLVQYRQHATAQTDVARRKDRRGELSGSETFERREQWLATLARLPSAHQAYFQALHRAWQDVGRSWYSLPLLRLLWERRCVLFCIDRRARRRQIRNVLHAAIGMRLRRLFNPRRYPRLPSPSSTV